MSQNYKNSFFVIVALVFLLPLFFIPGASLPIDTAKTALLVLGILVSGALFLYESWRRGNVTFPRQYVFYFAALLPVVYLLSALLTTPSSLSLLGYNFDVGTFGFVLLGSALLVLAALVFNNSSRVLSVLGALFATLTLVALFAVVKVLSGGNILVLGNFTGNMGNPLGSWTDLGLAFGLLSVLSMLAIGMVPMKMGVKSLLYAIFAISTILLAIVGFSSAFAITLGASVLIFFYFRNVERDFSPKTSVMLPIILGVISLLLLINPPISKSQGNLSTVVSRISHVSNADVRPTLSATLGISKAVLSQVALLGSGPNTFQHDWLIFKPVNVNATPFWGIAFPYGIGFVPTQIATTGILGTALWLSFLVAVLILALKSINHIPESRAMRFALVSSLFVTIFMWAGSVLYTPSLTMLMLSFAFTGVLIAMAMEAGVIRSKALNMRENASARLASVFLVVLTTVGMLYLGWISTERTIASYYFERAIALSNKEGTSLASVETKLEKAVKFAPLDVYYVAISRLNFAKAQSAASATTGTADSNKQIFQEGLSKSVAAAKAAVTVNPAGYQNWVALGSIYSALVGDPLKVEGAYENAQYAYSEAYKRNPNDPQLPLLLAQLEYSKGNVDNARSYIQRAEALKPDYADAYQMAAQLEIQQNNISGAIASAETLSQLQPDNAGVYFELGVLKYSATDYKGAESALTQALKLVPNYANAQYYLALALSKEGRADEAKQKLQELLAANPDNAQLKAAIDELNAPAKKKK